MGCAASAGCKYRCDAIRGRTQVFPEVSDGKSVGIATPGKNTSTSKIKGNAVQPLPDAGMGTPLPYTPSQDVVDACQKAEDPTNTIIELKRLKMTGFPVDLLCKTLSANGNINAIQCDINDIVALPPLGSSFGHLRVLQLNINRLQTFPDLSQVHALKRLSLSSNSMTELPNSLSRMCPVGLEELFINRNKLTCLAPETFTPITAVAAEGGLENKGLNSLKRLDLSDNKLTELPKSLGHLQNLEKLEINKNQLQSLTPSIGSLYGLLKLSIKGNRLATLPDSIGNLVNLNELCIGSNLLTVLPPEIGKLANLEILLSYGNQLESLPAEIGELANLKYLALQSNNLTFLPPSIGKLSLLEDLQLGFNKLGKCGCATIPNGQPAALPGAMTDMKNLNVLALESNEILAASFFVPVAAALSKLRTLHVQDNLIANPVPETTLANELKHIKAVTLHGNPCQDVPEK